MQTMFDLTRPQLIKVGIVLLVLCVAILTTCNRQTEDNEVESTYLVEKDTSDTPGRIDGDYEAPNYEGSYDFTDEGEINYDGLGDTTNYQIQQYHDSVVNNPIYMEYE